MMHYSASIASLASPDPIFIAFLTLALERSPRSPSQKAPLNDHPPHTPFTHFVRSKSSSLAYRLAFVIYPMFISSDAFGTNVLRPDANGFPPVSSKCAVIQALEPGHRRHRPVTRRWCGLHKCHVSQIKKENNNPPSAICYKNRKTSSLNQNL